jgi:hypothetical protein
MGMLGAEHLLGDRQRALEERPRPRKVALVRKQQGEVVEARGRIWMLGAERLFSYRQCIAEKLRRLRVSRAAVQIASVIQAARNALMVELTRCFAAIATMTV